MFDREFVPGWIGAAAYLVIVILSIWAWCRQTRSPTARRRAEIDALVRKYRHKKRRLV